LAAELLKVSAVDPDKKLMRYAAEFIGRGEVVGIATDTFYGLAADPFNLAAVEEIYRVKGRPEDRALPILVNSVEQALALTRDAPPLFLTLAQKFWPGALWIVSAVITLIVTGAFWIVDSTFDALTTTVSPMPAILSVKEPRSPPAAATR